MGEEVRRAGDREVVEGEGESGGIETNQWSSIELIGTGKRRGKSVHVASMLSFELWEKRKRLTLPQVIISSPEPSFLQPASPAPFPEHLHQTSLSENTSNCSTGSFLCSSSANDSATRSSNSSRSSEEIVSDFRRISGIRMSRRERKWRAEGERGWRGRRRSVENEPDPEDATYPGGSIRKDDRASP